MINKSLRNIIVIITVFIFASGALNAQDDRERFNVALKAFSDNFYEASLSLFERFVDEFPESPLVPRARLYVAKCYYYNQNYPRALEAFKELLEPVSEDYSSFRDEIYFFLGLIHFKGKNFQESLQNFEKIINDYRNSEFIWNAFYMSGRNYIEIGEFENAEAVLKRVIKKSAKVDLTGKAYLQLMNLKLKDEDYAGVLKLGSEYFDDFAQNGDDPRVYFYLGESHYALENWGEALDNYQKALTLNPDNKLKDLLQQSVGLTYLAKGDLNKAKSSIDSIANREMRFYSQGLYYFKTEDYIQALETFNMFMRNFPRSNFISNVYLNKADLFYEMGRLKDSLFTYKYIIDNFDSADKPDIINKAHYGLAWCYLKDGEFKKAIEEFKKTIEYTDNPTVKISSQIQIADAYQEAGRYTEALDLYNNILKENPGTIYADYIQFQIGTAFLKSQQLEKALMALRNLKNNFPNSKLIPQAQYYLAVGYFTGEDYIKAKALLEDFFEKHPRSELIPRAYYLYGKCFFNEGKYRKAIEVFQSIIDNYEDKDIEEFVYIDMGNAYVNLDLYNEARSI
ncbi:MAG: tetratricopeptide repeat protein, partial [Candidatus Omnitrophica bacterium]|nr:tetratricopeptide repeat protein [Candidatus Omnitrophota bacterium]MBD3269065.1 tetratricopeptide repeat protein [Candidatus Omnitrophota bacterium]